MEQLEDRRMLAIQAFPTPLQPLDPGIPLVYARATTASIDSAGEIETFEIALDGGQTVSLVVDPAAALAVHVEIRDSSSNLLGEASSGGAGLNAVVQAAMQSTGGYTINVSGVGETTGSFSLQLLVNTAVEAELHDGATNDSAAAAQDLEATFIDLGNQRGAGSVVGALSPGGGTPVEDWYQMQLQDGQSASLALHSLSSATTLLEVYASDGATRLAVGTAADGRHRVDTLVDATTDQSPDTYFLRVTGSNASYLLQIAKNARLDAEPNDSMAAAQDVADSQGALGRLSLEGSDYFEVSANIGDVLAISTATPGQGVGQPVNMLDPQLEVLDPNGALVPHANSAGNESFNHVASIAGRYTVRVFSEADGGDYLLEVAGATGPPKPFAVGGSTPADGAVILAPPVRFTVELSDDVLVSTVDASDLLIGGSAMATAVTVIDGRTLAFDLPALAPAVHVVTLAGGSMKDLQGQDLESYTSQFEIEPPLAVATVTPADGALVIAAPNEIRLELSDDIVASSVDVSDLLINGAAAATGVTVAGPRTVIFDVPELPPGLHSVALAGGALEDVDGQLLEPFASQFEIEPFFTVVGTTPADGAVLPGAPTQFIIELSDDVLASSVDAADLLIGGAVVATGVTIVEGRTLVFDLPPLAEGVYVISLGAMEDVDGQTLEEFTSQFEVDLIAPRVISSSLVNGSLLPVGSLSITFGFSEALNAAALDPGDVLLVGETTGAHFPSSLTYNGSAFTLTVHYANLPEDYFTLTLSSSAASFQDLAGNNLDGEFTQVPSGDGLAGGDFVEVFSTDVQGTTLPLARQAPLGSLVFASRGAQGLINSASDADQFQFYVQAGQTLTAVVRPVDPLATLSLQALGISGQIAAPAPGLPVVLPFTAIGQSGPAVLRIKGDRETAYQFDVVVNAAIESLLGDSSMGHPLDLGSSLLDVGLGRMAALGRSTPAQFAVGSMVAEPNDTIAAAVFSGVGWGHDFYASSGQIGDNAGLLAAGLDVDLVAVQLAAGDQLSITLDAADIGSPLDAVLRLFNSSGQQLTLSDDIGTSTDPRIEYDATAAGTYYVGVSSFANLAYNPLIPGSGIPGGTGGYELTMALNGGQPGAAPNVAPVIDVPDVDEYQVDWTGMEGQTVDIVLAGLDGANYSGEELVLLSPTGATVATATPPPGGGDLENYDLGIFSVQLPASGVYTVRFTSTVVGEYTLLTTQGGVFDQEPNDDLSDDVRQIAVGQAALGFLMPPAPPLTGGLADGDGGTASSVGAMSESEPNNFMVQATAVSLGFDPGEQSAIDVSGSLAFADVDFYKISLRPGDILGVSVDGGPLTLSLRDSSGAELLGSTRDVSQIHPPTSPLHNPGTAASLARVIDAEGDYYLRVSGPQTPSYDLSLRLYRPALESQPLGSRQSLFIDFDGASIDRSIFGGAGIATLSPLGAFLSGWGLTAADENAVIDAILAVVEENLSADLRAFGGNGDFASSGAPGDFDVEILNSRDHADPFGGANVSRIIIGGGVAEFGFLTIGLAESIDVGNFDTEESAVVLLDVLSGPADPLSSTLNRFVLDPSKSIIDLIGVGVGNIASHEAAHIFGNFHTENSNAIPILTDLGGKLNNSVGLVGEVWGDGDEIDVDFGPDKYAPSEEFTGIQHSHSTIAFGLATPVDPALLGPRVMSASPPNGPSLGPDQLVVVFNETLSETAANSANYQLIEAGPNRVFDGGLGDDFVIPLTAVFNGDRTVELLPQASSTPLPVGKYQLTVTSAVADVSGNALNSRTGSTGGSDHVHEMEIVSVGPGGDLYQVQLTAGQVIRLSTQTPWDDPSASTVNDLQPQLSIFDANGVPIAVDAGSLDGKNALIEVTVSSSGLYTVQVLALSGAGEYVLKVASVQPTLLADFDADNDIDGADFLAWQRGLGLVGEAQKSDGDADGDGDVDAVDLGVWQAGAAAALSAGSASGYGALATAAFGDANFTQGAGTGISEVGDLAMAAMLLQGDSRIFQASGLGADIIAKSTYVNMVPRFARSSDLDAVDLALESLPPARSRFVAAERPWDDATEVETEIILALARQIKGGGSQKLDSLISCKIPSWG